MRIGIVCCAIMRQEMEILLSDHPCKNSVIFLDAGKHVRPKELRESVLVAITSIQGQVDVVVLGYGPANR